MIRKLARILISFLSIFFSLSQHLGKNSNGLDLFKIDLDLPPEKRFVEVGKYFKSGIQLTLKYYFPFPLQYLVKLIGKIFWKLKPENYLEAIGLSEAVEIDPNIILAIQYIYDLSAFCTSVITKDKNGTIIHARNLDFLYASQMRNITYEGHFYKNNKTIFTAVMFAPLNTVMTGFKNNAFSISLNERKPSYRKSPLSLLSNVARIIKGYVTAGTLIRDTLETCDDFTCAFEKLRDTKQISAAYYAVAGVNENEGAVISKGAEGPDHIDKLGENQWYIVQTNDDHWKGICNIRCSYVKDSLDYIGREDLKAQDLLDILKKWPSNNIHSIYSTLFIPSKATFVSYLLDGDKPAPNEVGF
jgi:hypothetical protein